MRKPERERELEPELELERELERELEPEREREREPELEREREPLLEPELLMRHTFCVPNGCTIFAVEDQHFLRIRQKDGRRYHQGSGEFPMYPNDETYAQVEIRFCPWCGEVLRQPCATV